MDNPSYFQSQCSGTHPNAVLVQEEPFGDDQDLYAAFKVDDTEALKNLDENFNELSSRLVQSSAEPPSVKLMKKCSLRRLLSQKTTQLPFAKSWTTPEHGGTMLLNSPKIQLKICEID